jgi:hypothetical protein
MTGYTRQSSADIIDGNTISAANHNNEFNALVNAFHATTGHDHSGGAAEGAPIEVIGPAQDFIAGAASLSPKTTATYSLGTTLLRYTTGWFSGQVTAAGGFAGALTGNVTGAVTGNVTGNLTGNVTGDVTGNLTGNVTGNAATATKLATARTITLSGDLSGSASFDGSANVTITGAVSDDSHTHDTRYYTESEIDTALALKANLASPTFTGTPAAPTAAADTTTIQLATTAFVIGQASSSTPVMDGTAAVGTSLKYARADHVHASDTSKPAIPIGSSGVGQFAQLSAGSGVALALASGGTWAYFAVLYDSTTKVIEGSAAGVAAGGSTIASGVVGRAWVGWAWRIS